MIFLQFKGKQVSHADLILLFNFDKPAQGGMGIAFRLKEDHINPNSFAKMNVRLMAQVHRIIMKKKCLVSKSRFTITYIQILDFIA